MARNVEIKARLRHPELVRQRAEELADGASALLTQHDTFYSVPTGRLKLRVFPEGSGELISYRRSDEQGPKTSEYHLARTSTPKDLHVVLDHALGVRRVVEKRRILLMHGRTRIHLDEVKGLGHFLELEVMLNPDESEAEGVRVAHDLLSRLGVSEEDLVRGAYADLLDKQETVSEA